MSEIEYKYLEDDYPPVKKASTGNRQNSLEKKTKKVKEKIILHIRAMQKLMLKSDGLVMNKL